MKNLDIRDYKETIKAAVAAEREDDPNWTWRIRSITKRAAKIGWGYLDYLGEKDASFAVEILQGEEDGDITVYGINPNGNRTYRFIGSKHWHDCQTIEEGIVSAIHGMASSARRTY